MPRVSRCAMALMPMLRTAPAMTPTPRRLAGRYLLDIGGLPWQLACRFSISVYSCRRLPDGPAQRLSGFCRRSLALAGHRRHGGGYLLLVAQVIVPQRLEVGVELVD